ncbi:hypothetical protein INT48_002163 [Thamnidium elegans]|uniref:DUF7330 domain-containing protein n=1 Tax=Thamnidium elegans TaxID=101142 RepID=A0A8H7SYG5_9FUNG|nr:hypothetical protein INT48_002163 [Thamnidium elegans]
MTEKHPLESPPPYTETSTASAPPDYDTAHHQPSNLESPASPSPSTDSATDANDHYNRRRSPLLQNISYDSMRGPIGNIMSMTEALIGNATSAANAALGSPGSSSAADLGANVSRSANALATNVSKTAMDLVGGFINKREFQRQARRSNRRGHRKGTNSGSSNSSPERNTTSDCDSNADSQLQIIKHNSALELNKSWSGSSCFLKTANGSLTVHGSLSASDDINLENTNGIVAIDGQLLASNLIRVKSSNGTFTVRGDSIISNKLDVSLTNAPLNIRSFIQATYINLKTKNAPVNLSNVSLGKELTVKTSNAPIDIHILDISNDTASIHIETSNASVNVFVPSSFAGYFSVKSNSNGSVNVSAKSTEQSLLHFDTNEKSKKEGVCKNVNNKSNFEITIKTSNAVANLYI